MSNSPQSRDSQLHEIVALLNEIDDGIKDLNFDPSGSSEVQKQSLEELMSKIRQAFGTVSEESNVNIEPEVYLELFKLAHERDISISEYIVEKFSGNR